MTLNLLEGYIEVTPFSKLIAKCSSEIVAIELLEKQPVDLIFTDIQMLNLSGMEFSKLILNKKIRIIFTTAFEEFALVSYELNAIYYLVRSISYLEFLVTTI
ncbi:response regulator [uncultured Tenacibaculum sp.]|uniref:LytR/AlgR family response regulator transcription factor n=1 Tax=uncultured Tenacibaculum sp. TaxID=174713 RepID=UPI0026384D6D|nr:response regulator [uncultured Tenacibaculum sp.]